VDRPVAQPDPLELHTSKIYIYILSGRNQKPCRFFSFLGFGSLKHENRRQSSNWRLDFISLCAMSYYNKQTNERVRSRAFRRLQHTSIMSTKKTAPPPLLSWNGCALLARIVRVFDEKNIREACWLPVGELFDANGWRNSATRAMVPAKPVKKTKTRLHVLMPA
jgi:hypothetical protein